jgi:pyruvate formate lyase activating enzyme
MNIGGLQKFSLIDYPDRICAIIFTQGCNFRCPYCHNPELVNPKLFGDCMAEEEVLSFLKKRKGKLDAVSITGGEPTLQDNLVDFITKLKSMNYLVKIDTNGSHPAVLETLLLGGLLDYIAMDVKAPPKKYQSVTRSKVTPADIKQSIELIRNSSIPYEFRTTVVKSQLDEKDLLTIGRQIKNARRYVLQKFVSSKTMDPRFSRAKTYANDEFAALREKLAKHVETVILR